MRLGKLKAPFVGRTRAPGTPALLVLCAAVAAVAKVLLALNTYGTNDVFRYEVFLAWSRQLGVEIYHAAWDFNHPPSMIHVLRFLGWLTSSTRLSFGFWLRLPGIFADAGTLWLVWSLLGGRNAERKVVGAFYLMALTPVSLMVSGFHGNTDPVMVFFLVLSVWLTEKGRHGSLAGGALALSMCFKVVPLIVLPVMFFYYRGVRRQLEFFGGWGLVLMIAWQPYLFQDPAQIYHQMLGYRSLYGIWGLAYLLDHLARVVPPVQELNAQFQTTGPYALLVVCIAAAYLMNRVAKEPPRLFAQVGFVFLIFLTACSGFGVQYLAWLVPWVVALGVVPAAIYYSATGMFLFGVYNFWCQGMPWYLADSNRVGWTSSMDVFQVLAWLAVVLMLYVSWRSSHVWKDRRRSKIEHAVVGPVDGRWAMAGAVPFLVLLGVQVLALQDTGAAMRATMGPSSLQPIRTEMQIGLSHELYVRGRYEDGIAAASEALKLDSGSADAYHNIAASLAALGRWNEAAVAAREAHRLKPTLQNTKVYIVVAYKSLIEELTKNDKGENVRSLLNILRIPDALQDDAITKIRALSEAYTDIPVFANRVVEMFLK